MSEWKDKLYVELIKAFAYREYHDKHGPYSDIRTKSLIMQAYYSDPYMRARVNEAVSSIMYSLCNVVEKEITDLTEANLALKEEINDFELNEKYTLERFKRCKELLDEKNYHMLSAKLLADIAALTGLPKES